MNKKWLLPTVFLAIIGAVIWNYPTTYRIGIDGELYVKKIPFYAKACGFLYRDWVYKDLVREIVGGEQDETRKALAILNWTHNNITSGVPRGCRTMDDHPLNIIIRQYGAKDQAEDVFTILCSYAGMRASMEKIYNADRSRYIVLSFVDVTDKQLVFDASRGKYFLNKQGTVASISDFAYGDVVLSDEEAAAYRGYVDDLKNFRVEHSTRPEEQMPFRRVVIEIEKLFKKER